MFPKSSFWMTHFLKVSSDLKQNGRKEKELWFPFFSTILLEVFGLLAFWKMRWVIDKCRSPITNWILCSALTGWSIILTCLIAFWWKFVMECKISNLWFWNSLSPKCIFPRLRRMSHILLGWSITWTTSSTIFITWKVLYDRGARCIGMEILISKNGVIDSHYALDSFGVPKFTAAKTYLPFLHALWFQWTVPVPQGQVPEISGRWLLCLGVAQITARMSQLHTERDSKQCACKSSLSNFGPLTNECIFGLPKSDIAIQT